MFITYILFWIILALILITVTGSLTCLFWKIYLFDKVLAAVICLLLLFFIGYQYYENNRVVIKRETVLIGNLPPAFEGFTILLLADLHGKNFGREQADLIALVNQLDYDMVAITGDMETASGDFAPFLTLLEGIANSEHVFYVNGNFDLAYDPLTGHKTQIGALLEAHGCVLLNQPYPLVRDGYTLWLTELITRPYHGFDIYEGIPRHEFRSDEAFRDYQQHLARLGDQAGQINPKADIQIGLAHIPLTQADLESQPAQTGYWDLDLVMAGHYHGGQVRIPGYGAPFIPIGTTPAHDGFFPDQRYVSGLVAGKGVQQYVSRGLGASNLPFRLFNPPEINLLTLKAQNR